MTRLLGIAITSGPEKLFIPLGYGVTEAIRSGDVSTGAARDPLPIKQILHKDHAIQKVRRAQVSTDGDVKAGSICV
jgi:hypothetical protein